MNQRRVVITGLGVVAPGALGAQALLDNLLAKRSATRKIDLFDASGFPCSVGAQLDDFSATRFVPRSYRKAVKVMARDIEIAVAASDLAVRDSGIVTRGLDEKKPDVDGWRLGCNIGAGLICADLNELGAAVNTAVRDGKFDIRLWGAEGLKNLTPLWLLKYLPNMLACHVTIIHGARGPSNTITCGEASGTLAAGEAARQVARGACDVAIAGGAESKLNPMGLLRQGLMGRLNTAAADDPARAVRPFDAAHAGTVIGEGGGILILEDLARALARKARIYAEIAGFGAACDPDGVDYSRPAAGGIAASASAALRDAKSGAADVDLVIAHGTGVPGEDVAEAKALRQVLGGRASDVPVVLLTGAIGDLFAGAGGVHLAIGALCIAKGVIPPTVNFQKPDPACALNVTGAPIRRAPRTVLCVVHGVGGQSGAVVLRRYES